MDHYRITHSFGWSGAIVDEEHAPPVLNLSAVAAATILPRSHFSLSHAYSIMML